MKYIKGIWNFIGGLIALVLSFVLVFVLLAMPVMFTVHMATEPEGLQQLLLMLTAKDSPPTEPEEILIQEMMQSNAAKELLQLYKEDLFAQLQGKAPSVNEEAVLQIAQNNMDELVPMLREMAQYSGFDISDLSDAQLAGLTQQMAAYYGGQLLENLPSMKQLGIQPLPESSAENILVVDMELVNRLLSSDFRREDIPAVITQLMILLNDYLGVKLLGMVAALLSLLIVIFRLGQQFRCITWLGSNHLIGGCIGFALGIYGKMSVRQMFSNPNMPPIEGSLQAFLNWFSIGSAAILVLGIVFLLISAGGNSWVYRHRKMKLEK